MKMLKAPAFQVVLLCILLFSCASSEKEKATPDTISLDSEKSSIKPSMTIFDAARQGNLTEVENNLSSGSKVNDVNGDGATALHLAAGMNHPKVVSKLLDHGAEIDSKVSDGQQTPLHLAAFFDAKEAAKVLVERKANIEAIDDGGNTPLLLAASEGAQGTARLLLEAGANLEARRNDDAGGTPLMLAAFGRHKNMVELLLSKGASASAKSKRGSTAEAVAQELGYEDIVQVFRIYKK